MQVCASPSEPSRTDTVQGQRGRGTGPASYAVFGLPVPGFRNSCSSWQPLLAHPSEEGPPFSGARHLGTSVQITGCGRLSVLPLVVEVTITQARALSTRRALALEWSLFAVWCSSRREDPRRCTNGVVLSFLQEGLECRLSPSTLKVYVAAIAAHLDAMDSWSLGKHDLIISGAVWRQAQYWC